MSRRRFLAVLCLGMLASASRSEACTGIRVVARDGSIVRARTMEFGIPTRSDLIVVPRGHRFSAAEGAEVGLSWTGKYGFAGASMLGRPIVADGVNEKGLSVGMFYFPGSAHYRKAGPGDAGKSLAPWDVATYALSTCATADEAAAAIEKGPVVDVAFKEWGIVPPLHYVFADASGRCVVVEHTADGVRRHDNPLGVITNSPAFDWHMTNLRNYVGLSMDNASPVSVGDLTLTPFGQGSGMRGLPGDFTPPSRFVRAAAFSLSALPVAKAEDGVEQAFHILNQFDIPEGSVREKHDGREASESTQWTCASDCTNRRFYIRTHENSRIRMVDLGRCDLDAKGIVTIGLKGTESFEDVTPGRK
jgi:choloylglycine hydrolase